MEKNTRDYTVFHQSIADELGITLRDVIFFRVLHFAGGLDIAHIVEKINMRLPNLKKSGSYRVKLYEQRLQWIEKVTQSEWATLTKAYLHD